MLKLLLVVQMAAATLIRTHQNAVTVFRSARRTEPGRTERGSVTIEQVLWAGAVIVIVGIVVAAITGYVRSKAGDIK